MMGGWLYRAVSTESRLQGTLRRKQEGQAMEQADFSFFFSLAEFSFLEAGMGDKISACFAPEGSHLAFDLQLVSAGH